MSENTSITQKVYKKLILKTSLQSLSFCTIDTLQQQIISFNEYDFGVLPKTNRVEDHLWKVFLDDKELTKTYDEVVVLHENTLNTFVPKVLFDEEFKGSYLQYNTKVFETDFFTFDTIENFDMVNVYVPYVNINNYLIDQFGTFTYKHASSVLVSKILEHSKIEPKETMYIHLNQHTFEIVVVENQKLLLFNTFEYKTAEDFIYYLLFTAEQLRMNPETFQLKLLGSVTEIDTLYQKAFQFVRNVSLMDVTAFQKNNAFLTSDNRKHFILFNS